MLKNNRSYTDKVYITHLTVSLCDPICCLTLFLSYCNRMHICFSHLKDFVEYIVNHLFCIYLQKTIICPACIQKMKTPQEPIFTDREYKLDDG